MHLQEKVQELKVVDGKAVGYSGQPGDFFLLVIEVLENFFENSIEIEEVYALISNSNPVVRAFGLQCLAIIEKEKFKDKLIRKLKDKEKIEFCASGCDIETSTVSKFSRSLLGNIYILGNPLRYKKDQDELRTLLERDYQKALDEYDPPKYYFPLMSVEELNKLE